MISLGFQLNYLTLTGPEVDDATVTFGPGLNVISGPSDTGKTFIAECINFAFGSSTSPGDIPEAKPYDTVIVGITDMAKTIQYKLVRSLRGGATRLSALNQDNRILADKHDPKSQETISYFLLSLCGLAGRMVRTNSQGKTRQISFRDIARLIVIAEQGIIRKDSHVHSGQYSSKTVENNVFSLLLSGIDDTSVVALPDRKTVITKNKGKEELLDLLISQAYEELDHIAPDSRKDELMVQLQKTETSIDETRVELGAEQQVAAVLEENRKSVWLRLKENQSRQSVLSELQNRFRLLKTQYTSDLRRLESIAETGSFLGQMEQEQCPLCGAEAQYQIRTDSNSEIEPTLVAHACAIEGGRLKLLMRDLDDTIVQNEVAEENIGKTIVTQKKSSREFDEKLTSYYKPRLTEMLNRIQNDQVIQGRLQAAVDLHNRIEELKAFRTEVEVAPKITFIPKAAASETDGLAVIIEEILSSWQFPNLKRVTFDSVDQDILVSGRKRSDHGKGVRAITHAAFTVALMYYCLDNDMPHPGVVIIDSPLVVYREPDAEEAGFSRNLKDLAYSYLAAQVNRGQVIVLENEDPPSDLPNSPTIIRFTGANHGRKGFIPSTRVSPTTVEL